MSKLSSMAAVALSGLLLAAPMLAHADDDRRGGYGPSSAEHYQKAGHKRGYGDEYRYRDKGRHWHKHDHKRGHKHWRHHHRDHRPRYVYKHYHHHHYGPRYGFPFGRDGWWVLFGYRE